MLQDAVDDQRDGLQAAVRMPLEARRGEPVLGHEQERVRQRGVIRHEYQRLVVDLLIRPRWVRSPTRVRVRSTVNWPLTTASSTK